MWMCTRCQSINEDAQELCPRCRAAKEGQAAPVVRPSALAPQFSQPFDPTGTIVSPVTPDPGYRSNQSEQPRPGMDSAGVYPGYEQSPAPQGYPEPPVTFGTAPGGGSAAMAGYPGAPQAGASAPVGYGAHQSPVEPTFAQPLPTGEAATGQTGYGPPAQAGFASPSYGSAASSSSGAGEVAAIAALGIGALLLRLLHPIRLIFIAIGIACILGGNYLANRRTSFMAHAIRVSGTVTALKEQTSGDSTTYYPVVAFTTKEGLPVSMTSTSGSRPPEFHVGETCVVYYNPLAPTDAVVDSASSKLIPWFLWGFGGIVILAALFGRQTAT